MLLVQHQADGVPVSGLQISVLFRKAGIVGKHLLIRQVSAVHSPHMDAGLVLPGHPVEIQSGIAGEYRHVKGIIIGPGLFPRILQRRKPVLLHIRNLPLHIRKPRQFKSQDSKPAPHGLQLCLISRTV